MRRERWRAALLPATFLGLALLYLWPLVLHPNWVAYAPGARFSDLLVSHLPNAEYVRASLARYGQWPLWNAQIFAGQPFAADPLSGLWYPPNLLLLIAPLPLGFNMLLGLHVAWAGLGLFWLLRAEGVGLGPALFGGAAFAGAPKLVAHLAAGHVSLIFAVAWTPWLLWAVRQATARAGPWPGAKAGAILALIFVADIRWAYYAGLLALGYWGYRWAEAGQPGRRMALSPQAKSREHSGTRPWVSLAAFLAIAAALSAVLALPLLEFVRRSSRAGLSLDEAGVFSLPPQYLLGLIIPNLGGFHEWMTYAGVVPLLLAVLGLWRRQWFWVAAVPAAGSLAMGTHIGLYPLIFHLVPGLSYLRVPARAWFVVELGLCVLAGHGAQMLVEIWPRLLRRPGWPRRMPTAATVLAVLVLFTIVDLLRVDSTLIEARPRPALNPAAIYLKLQDGIFRVYSPSYSLPPGDGLEHLDGVGPLQLKDTVDYFETATGVAASGYSVTLPAFASGNVESDNANARPDAGTLGRLNVRYMAADFPINAPDLQLVEVYGATRVYENRLWLARTRMESGGGEAPRLVAWSPNRIEVEANGPGRLILAEVDYPGWIASVDGQPVDITASDGLFRAVTVPAGARRVIFEFRPASLFAGAALSGLGLAALLVLALRATRVHARVTGAA